MNKVLRIGSGSTVILFSALSLLLPFSAGAVGVAVRPAELEVQASVGKEALVRINVSNPSSDVAIFEVYPDEFEQLIKITPSSFTLESGSEQYVSVKITPATEGRMQTNLSVVGRPLSTGAFGAGSGVKLPLVVIAKVAPAGLAAAVAVLGSSPWLGVFSLVVLVGWFGYRRYLGKSLKAGPKA